MERRSIAAGFALTLSLGCASSPRDDTDVKLDPRSSSPASQASTAPSAAPPKATDSLAGWLKFKDRTGVYELMMPLPPTELDTTAATDAGKKTLHLASAGVPDGVFMAQYAEIGDAPTNFDGAVVGLGGTASSVKTVKVQGKYEGREIEATKDGKKVFVQIFVVGNRVFSLMTMGVADAVRVRAFWDSFRILD